MPDRVFLVGAPRSGTTWLQHMLGAHPDVATGQETDLVDGYLAPWLALWERQLPDDADEWRRRRYKGLPATLTEDEFLGVLRSVAERVHDAVLSLKPGARIVLEKVPAYAFHGPLILRLFPDARFVHLIRDGRDVAASMVRASRGWGRFWAPASVEDAARRWRQHVEAARAIADRTDRYHEVRYERLLPPHGPAALLDALRSCGVEADTAAAGAIHARFTSGGGSSLLWGGEVARRHATAPREPEGFAGEGGAGAWRRDLSPYDRAVFDEVAGTLLSRLGYEDDRHWARAGLLDRARSRARRLRPGWTAG